MSEAAPKLSSTPAIPGYELEKMVGRGATSAVYRARATKGGGTFAVKLLSESGSMDQGLRFRREVAALARLSHSGLVRVIESGEHDGRSFLVMEYVDGGSLHDCLRNGPLPPQIFFPFAKMLVGALSEVHRRGLIHRDIKPSNILLDDDNLPKLIDFGLVVAGTDTAPAGNEKEVVGTLLYSSPEQSGMLKRPVDARSDLYSVGALLFECLVGQPPFNGDSIPELLQKHAAMPAPDVRQLNPAVGPALSMIVAKLLAKDPDDRYQTAQSLVHDLEIINELEAALSSEKRIQLGQRDLQTRLLAHQVPLIGRDTELNTLRRLWGHARTGKRSIVQIEGEAGSGKTRLIRELVRNAVDTKGEVLFGKAQVREQVPFGPLREALDDLAARVLALPAEPQAAAVAAIKRAAGDCPCLVRRLSRGLKKILADAPEISPLPIAEDEQRRFYDNVADFFIDLPSQLGAPVLFIVDDTQWLDAGSLEVLKRVAATTRSTRMLIAATARNDADSTLGRDRFLTEMGGEVKERVVLTPLGLEAVQALIAAHLGGDKLELSMVERLARVTNGNAFAIGEFVRSMLDSGIMRPTREGWVVNAAKFNEIALSSDVLQLVINRLASLTPETRAVLNVAAAVGMRFDIRLVSEASHLPLEATVHAMEEAGQASLIEQLTKTEFTFVHDRLGEALIHDLSELELRDVHQGVAEALDARGGELTSEEVLSLARSYARGHIERNYRRVYETSLAAGQVAMQDYSYALGLEPLKLSLSAALKAEIPEDELTSLREAIGGCHSRLGHDKEAREHLESALAHAKDNLAVARIRYLIADALFNAGRAVESWKYIQDALEAARSPLPKSKLLLWVYSYWYWILGIALSRSKWGFGAASPRDREMLKVVVSIYEIAAPIAMVLGDWKVYLLILTRWIVIGHRLGMTSETARGLTLYGYVLGEIGIYDAGERQCEMAGSIGKQLGDPQLEWHAIQRQLLVQHMRGAEGVTGTDVRNREHMPQFKKWLSPWETNAVVASYTTANFWRGRANESVRFAEEHLAQQEGRRNLVMSAVVLGELYSQLQILGRHADGAKARETFLATVAELGFVPWVQGMSYYFDLVTLLDQGDHPRLMEAMNGYMQVVYERGIQDPWTRFGFLACAEGRFEIYVQSSGHEREQARRNLQRAIRMARARSHTPVFQCYLLAVEGAFAREEGNLGRARRKLDRAEELAAVANSSLAFFLIARERARIAVRVGNIVSTRKEAESALEIATREGWVNRTRRIKEEFKLMELEAGAATTMGGTRTGATSSTRTTGSDVTSARYASTLLQVSLASTSTLDAGQQANAALLELVKVLGAERGFLFLRDAKSPPESGEMRLEAGKDHTGKDLGALTGFSRTVVQRVARTQKPVVLAGTDEGEAMGSESVVQNDLRSILAAPLMFRDTLLGVVYLDSRLVKGLFTDDDLGILQAIASHIAIAIETAKAARLEAKRQALEKEMALTAAVQSLFLPKQSTSQLGRCRVSGFYRPAAECGGDWWWFGPSNSGQPRLLLGDVTGHGAASAMVTASVATTYQMLDQAATPTPLDQVLGALSRSLLNTTGGKYRMTMSVAEIDEEARMLNWVNAGAPPLLVLDKAGVVKAQSAVSMVLGDSEFVPVKRPLKAQPGDRFFFFTDGLTELKLPSGHEFGLRRLSKLLQKTRALPTDAAVQMIVAGLDEARQDVEQDDDITFILLDWE